MVIQFVDIYMCECIYIYMYIYVYIYIYMAENKKIVLYSSPRINFDSSKVYQGVNKTVFDVIPIRLCAY